MSKAKMQAAKELIQSKQYDEARALLKTVDDPTARSWLAKLDKISGPPLPSGYTQTDRANARMKSYTTQVIVVIILYFCLFIPGIIANVMWHQEGLQMEEIAGQELPGVGALGFMRRWIFVVFFLILLVIVIFGAASILQVSRYT